MKTKTARPVPTKDARRERMLADILKSALRYYEIPDATHFPSEADLASCLGRVADEAVRRANRTGGLTARETRLVEAIRAVVRYASGQPTCDPIGPRQVVLYIAGALAEAKAA